MLIQPLLDRLSALRLPGFRQALEEQMCTPTHYADLPFDERLAFLAEREWMRRENNRLQRNLKTAHFHDAVAVVEDLDLSPSRGVERRLVLELAQGHWVNKHLNVIVLGPTGVGKTFLSCALGQAVCRTGTSVRYVRASRLLDQFTHAHADGSYPKFLDALARVQLLILDDWLRDPINPTQARDLLEVIDDRYGKTSTMVASQIPVAQWHDQFQDATLADAILDRLVHNAYRLELKGESQRKMRAAVESQ